MTDKQKRFCDEYLIDRSAEQAALRAGYSGSAACRMGAENLKKPELQAYIERQLEQTQSERPSGPQSERPDDPQSERPDDPQSERPDVPQSERPDVPQSERPDDPQSERPKQDKVAGAEEVMEYLTSVMRGENSSSAQALKAAEIIGKRYGLFREGAGSETVLPVVISGGDKLED